MGADTSQNVDEESPNLQGLMTFIKMVRVPDYW